MREALTRFYESVGADAAMQASVSPLFAADPARREGAFVGAARCSSCHLSAFAQWSSTPHAAAFKTLLDAHRHFQPRCVSCHVVGFNTETGYKMRGADESLANVQCEVCHGPGGQHVAMPRRDNTLRHVPEAVCLECHTPEHSDNFVYESRLPRVVHRKSLADGTPARMIVSTR